MATTKRHAGPRGVWKLASGQHGVVSRSQLLELGYGPAAIRHRLVSGRLHRVHRGVYAVGRPTLGDRGRWAAAVLAVPGAVLSHLDAAAVWNLLARAPAPTIEVSVVARTAKAERPGLRVHRRRPGVLAPHRLRDGIPLTDPADTIVDIASRLSPAALERAINEADRHDLATPAQLRERAALNPRRPGAAAVRRLIDRVTYVLTDSELERRFLPLARRAGLPLPRTGVRLKGHKVDFFWPELGLVVETDGGRFHRTPFQQTRDRRRDQAHLAAGLTPMRFTHGQIRFEPDEVVATLRIVGGHLVAGGGRRPALR
jgi:very-short-patch-repair endonuclease/predicted transcriptional regulator of viral defense system